MRIVLVGPPGAGKGTQAKIIAGRLSIPAISTGTLPPQRRVGTPLGRGGRATWTPGQLVPDPSPSACAATG